MHGVWQDNVQFEFRAWRAASLVSDLLRVSLHGLLNVATLVATLVSQAARTDESVQPELNVIVTATRVPTPADQVLAPVVVIDRATIERSNAGDAAELLRFHAGLDVASNGGPGQPTALFIRGTESNHTLVLVDGIRINPGTIGLPGLQNIRPDMIERIEVVKGPRSALWGSDAIGGVVNIVTRRGSQDGWITEAGYGSYDTRRASVNGGFDLGESAALYVGLSWMDSDGFPTRTTDTVDRGYDSLSANVALRADVGAAEVTVRHWRTEGSSSIPIFSWCWLTRTGYVTSTTAAEVSLPVGEKGEARFAVNHLEDEIQQNQSPDFLETDRDTFDAQYDWKWSDVHGLGVGAMYTRERADSESYGEGFKSDTDAVNVYVQDRITSGPHLALSVLYTHHETAGSEFTLNAEYGYAFNEQRTRVYALAGSGVRAPDRRSHRVRRQSRPEARELAQLRSRREARTVTAAVAHVVGFPHGHRGPDRLHGAVLRSVRRHQPERRRGAHRGDRGVVGLHRLAVAGPRGSDLPGSTGPVRRFAVVAPRAGEPYRRPDACVRPGAARSRRARGGRTQGLWLSAGRDARRVRAREPDRRVARHTSLSLVARVENLLDEDYELADTYHTADRGLYVAVRYAPRAGNRGK